MASLVKWLFGSGAHDVTGAPVATGSVYFYVPGSSTEITIYSDPEETTPQAQPVVLDASGRAEVYVAARCEVKVLDALGATVALAEVGESVDAAIVDCTWGSTARSLDYVLTQLETNLGADAKYLEGGTNSVARTYQGAIRTHISPYDFNATWDGIADDTVPLQRAIDRAIATGLLLLLPPGSCKCTAGLTVNGDLRMIGPGKDNCLVYGSTTGFHLFTIDSGSATAGVKFAGFGALVPLTALDAVFEVDRAANAQFEDLAITGHYGITGHATNFKDSRISSCHVYTKNGVGFIVGDRVNIYDSVAEVMESGTGVGYHLYGSSRAVNCKAIAASVGFNPKATTAGLIGCTATACTADVSYLDAATFLSVGNSWDLSGDADEALITTSAGGTVSNALVVPGTIAGGARTVAFRLAVTAANPAVICTLTGALAYTVGIKTAQCTLANADGTGVRVSIAPAPAGSNAVEVTVAGVASAATVCVTLTGY